jgi:two-component system, LytTR family, sensor kinase
MYWLYYSTVYRLCAGFRVNFFSKTNLESWRNRIFFIYMRKTILYHILLWFTYQVLIMVGMYFAFRGDWVTMTDTFFVNLLYIGTFYLLYEAVFKPYTHDRRWRSVVVYVANLILIYLILLFSVHFLFTYFLELMPGKRGYAGNFKVKLPLMADVFNNFLPFSLYAFLYAQFNRRVQSEARLRKEQTEKLELANAKLKTEYDYLKSQINPHFLYNTLNFFYSKSLKQDKPMAEGIAVLSDLMRYSLDSGNAQGRVPLAEELAQIENYIHLQQLRFGNQLHIQFEQDAVPPGLTILPHSLITLVENAFKYGVSDEAAHPLRIALTMNGTVMTFVVSNKISHRTADRGGTGIGLQNLQKRLQLDYPARHEYVVERNVNDYYTTRLTINLQ